MTQTVTEPKPIDYDKFVLVVPAAEYRTEHYGITHESGSIHKVSGRDVHNPGYNHTVQVWEHRNGKDIWGNPTDAARTLCLSAQPSMLTAHPRALPIVGEELRPGDRVAVMASDDAGVRFLGGFEVTTKFLSDPILTPVDSIAESTISTL